MNRRLRYLVIASALFTIFLIAYIIVWLSGDFDNSQYADYCQAFVNGALALSCPGNNKLTQTINCKIKRISYKTNSLH